jgi:hypothetical protein
MDGIVFRTTDNTRWGAGGGSGTGGNITALQEDENKWAFLTRIQALENDPPEAVSISGFTIIGSQFQINMTDGSHHGPYTLPIATFHDQGTWVNDMPLAPLDLINSPGFGLYRVLIAHTTPSAPATFDPDAVDEDSGSPTFGQPLYQIVYGEQDYIYDVGFFFPGRPGIGVDDGSAMFGHVFVHPVSAPATLPGSEAFLKTDPASSMSMKIQKNGTDIGTVDFVAGSNTGTFTLAADASFAIGDRLTVLKPTAGVDTDARELSVSFKLVRTF